MCVDAIFTTYAFNAFAYALYIWYDYDSLVCVVLVVVTAAPGVFWFTLWKLLHFIPSKAHDGCLQLVRNSLKFCFSVVKSSGLDETTLALCVNDIFGPSMMMAVAMQVLVCVHGFSVYACGQGSTVFWCNQSVQEWYRIIRLYVFYCKCDGTIYVINMLQEVFFVLCVLYYKCVICKPPP